MLVPTRRSWKEVARVTGLTKKDTETIIDTVFGGVVHALHRGEGRTPRLRQFSPPAPRAAQGPQPQDR